MAKTSSTPRLEAHSMPFTSHRHCQQHPRMIVKAKGRYYLDDRGRRIFNRLSGLGCVGLRLKQPELQKAISQQLSNLDCCPPFQVAQPFRLAQRITELAPNPLNHLFFRNSGSEAADTSLKIAHAHWHRHGKAENTLFS